MEVYYKTEGYLKDASYTAELYSFMKGYEGKFPGADILNLYVDAIWIERLEYRAKKTLFEYSDDGKTLTVNTYETFNVNKSKNTGLASPQIFFINLKFLFDKAATEHNNRVGKKNDD